MLVKSARALFERQGFIETSVGDISKRAQVAHGTFYTYFNSKEEIFSEVADELQADLLRVAEAEPHLPPGSTHRPSASSGPTAGTCGATSATPG